MGRHCGIWGRIRKIKPHRICIKRFFLMEIFPETRVVGRSDVSYSSLGCQNILISDVVSKSGHKNPLLEVEECNQNTPVSG